MISLGNGGKRFSRAMASPAPGPPNVSMRSTAQSATPPRALSPPVEAADRLNVAAVDVVIPSTLRDTSSPSLGTSAQSPPVGSTEPVLSQDLSGMATLPRGDTPEVS
ncbi:hypothetical protein PLANTIT3_50527 [Plantibacter sp. T3]|nr:hypothetical protein PLANTIT3_50527 [Plantibacter sp. T3]